MARISSPWVGVGKGKLGEAVYYRRLGATNVRQYVQTIEDKDSIPQKDQREKFTLTLAFCKAFVTVIALYFTAVKQGITNFNSAMSYNIKNAISGAYPGYVFDYVKSRLFQGNLLNADAISHTNAVPLTIVVIWEDNSGSGNALATDECIVAIIDNVTHLTKFIVTSATRVTETASVTYPASMSAKPATVYVGFVSDDGLINSDSFAIVTAPLA